MNQNKIYDVIIIGGGVIGTAIARYLMRFDVRVLLLERHNDVGEEASGANSGIVHSGYDPKPGTKKAKFNVLGSKMMPEVAKELDLNFKQIGSLTLSFSEEDDQTLLDLKKRAEENGVDAKLLSKEEVLEIEPNLSKEIRGALLAPSAGIVSPFGLTVNLMENAMDNGAELLLNHEVIKIEKIHEFCRVFCKNGAVFDAKTVVDAAGTLADKVQEMIEKPSFKITPRKGEYFVLDHFNNDFIKHTIFMCPTKVGKGVLISQTTSGNYLVGPSNDSCEVDDVSTDALTLEEIKKIALKICPNLPFNETIREFSGVRPNSSNDDFIIEESKNVDGLFIIGGISSPGLASAIAIGDYVSKLIRDKLGLKDNLNYNPNIRKHISLSKIGEEKYNELIKKNPSYGKLICRCEKVSDGEIVDSIHRNCGAHTIKGIKKRIRPGFGKCQGTFCEAEVLKILARELNLPLEEICYSELGTNILLKAQKGAENE